jgi:hypothetical protein
MEQVVVVARAMLAYTPYDDKLIILKRAVASLTGAHLSKIALAFEFSVLTLTVPGLRPRKAQKSCVLLSTCAISSHLNCSF